VFLENPDSDSDSYPPEISSHTKKYIELNLKITSHNIVEEIGQTYGQVVVDCEYWKTPFTIVKTIENWTTDRTKTKIYNDLGIIPYQQLHNIYATYDDCDVIDLIIKQVASDVFLVN